jgi:hypothetical protein
MNGLRRLRDVLEGTVVLRVPRRRLATFGYSEIPYHPITPHPELPGRAHLRTGRVLALRPKILTPDVMARHFEGFGEEGGGFERLLKDHFSEVFRGLGYVFHNRLDNVAERHQDAAALAESVQKDLEGRDAPGAAVIHGPAWGWELSLMKFALEEAGRSFPVNVRELEERSLFDPAGAERRRRKAELERLFAQAARDPGALKTLAGALKAQGLFDEYQDRFFALVNAGQNR